jgi:DNA-binding NarL/FixJ family response regulator
MDSGGGAVNDVRVLVVDDHESFRHAVAAVIDETVGFIVVACAASGEESLALADEVKADLILMDVNLPGINGIEATRVLMRRPEPPIVVLLSTYDEGELDYDDSGAAAYITKSAFDPGRLADVWAAVNGKESPH